MNSTPTLKTNRTTKIAAAVSTVAVTVATIIYLWWQPVNFKGVYGNKVSTYILTKSGRTSEVAWLVKNGFNSYCGYGIEGYLSSNRADVQDFVLMLRRAGIKDVGLIYSTASTVLTKLDAYQKSCINDSCKFSFVVSEIEQYQSAGNRPEFYNTIRTVSNWATKNKVKLVVYQGWPNQADMDSIVKYTDRMFLHAYGVYSNYSNVGSWVHGYTSGRMNMIVNSMNTLYPNQTNKYNVVIIYSTENPDATKTQFGYKYFLTHGWQDAQSSYQRYYSINASSAMKTRIEIGGSQLFVEDQAKKIKP